MSSVSVSVAVWAWSTAGAFRCENVCTRNDEKQFFSRSNGVCLAQLHVYYTAKSKIVADQRCHTPRQSGSSKEDSSVSPHVAVSLDDERDLIGPSLPGQRLFAMC